MSIEEYKQFTKIIPEIIYPIKDINNFISVTKFIKLCSADAFTVSNYLPSKYRFYRYLQLDHNINLYFFLSTLNPSRLYVVVSTVVNFSSFSVRVHIDNSQEIVEKIKEEVSKVLDVLNNDVKELNEVYCIGHGVGGGYAYQIAQSLNLKAITIGHIILGVDSTVTHLTNKINLVNFLKPGDLLGLQQAITDNTYLINKRNRASSNEDYPNTLLEGLLNSSIDSYVKFSFYLEDLKEEQFECHPLAVLSTVG